VLLEEAMQPFGIGVRRVAGSKSAFAAEIWRAIATRRWDLVHAHGFTAAVVCAPIARLVGIPVLFTQHEVIRDDQYRNFRGEILRGTIRAGLALTTRIHSVSESAAANLRKLAHGRAGTCRRIVVVPNGIDAKRFAEAAPVDVRAELSLGPEAFIIGFFGRFMKPKGFGVLIEALRQLVGRSPGDRYPVVVAVGSGGFRAREERAITRLGLTPNVRFLGFRSDVAGLIKGVDVVAVPSLWEACGLIAMETLVCGTPLICSDCDGLAEVASGSPATVIPTENAEALADALAHHMRHDHLPAASEYAPAAAERFSADLPAERIATLYRELRRKGR
jgi:glycosyltransferase involved in cell wall biosynthesis